MRKTKAAVIIIAMTFCQIAIVEKAIATDVSRVQVVQLNVVEVAGSPNIIAKVSGGVPSSNCTDQTAYVRPLDDAMGRHLYAAALTALTTQKPIDFIGKGTCGVFDVETMQEIRIYNQ